MAVCTAILDGHVPDAPSPAINLIAYATISHQNLHPGRQLTGLLQKALERVSNLLGAPVRRQVHAASRLAARALVQDARLKVFAQKGHAKVIQGSSHGHDLLHDVAARAIVLHHPLDTSYLPGDTGKPALRIDLEFSSHVFLYDDATRHGAPPNGATTPRDGRIVVDLDWAFRPERDGTLLIVEIVVPEAYRYLYVQNSERPVVKIPDPVLRRKAAEVVKVSRRTQLLIDDLLRIMRKAHGVGLAATQIGILQRVIVVAPEGRRPTALINPRVLRAEGEYVGQEGCLSIPGLYGDVTRPNYVEVEALDRKGHMMKYKLEGMESKIVQHEIDHLDGILFIDKVDESTLHWSHPDHESAAVE